ncbi:MAG: AmmeMemoRadiSam system protein A [Phycisphaera sp.]|nr:AmmeMemoRadiSam system protein A [Phycisphaera sp.]
MGPTLLPEHPPTTLDPGDRATLLRIAQESILHRLEHHAHLHRALRAGDYSAALQRERASFVTLHLDGELRGCIGGLEAREPLVIDVARHAEAAAFTDPRFPPVSHLEAPRLRYHVSVINPAVPMHVESQRDLARQLVPTVDGLILEEALVLGQPRRATFLPAVWESVPDPEAFILHLKRKAGIPDDHWSEKIKVWRYTVESVE